MVPCDELLATQIEFTQHFLHPLRVNSKKSILDSKLNAHLSCSSALSKATGYPLAFVVAKLALGNPI